MSARPDLASVFADAAALDRRAFARLESVVDTARDRLIAEFTKAQGAEKEELALALQLLRSGRRSVAKRCGVKLCEICGCADFDCGCESDAGVLTVERVDAQ